MTIGIDTGDRNIAWYDLSLVFAKPEKYLVALLSVSQIVASVTVEDPHVGNVEIPTEVALCIPELFVPESHCLLDIIVESGLAVPSFVIVLQRKGILLRSGLWHLEHYPTCDVILVKDHDSIPESPGSSLRFEDGQPLFKTPRVLQEQGIHRGEIGQAQELDVRVSFLPRELSMCPSHHPPYMVRLYTST